MQCPDLGADKLPPEEQIVNGQVVPAVRKMPRYTMPILKVAPEPTGGPTPGTTFVPLGPGTMPVLCAPGFTGPDCRTPIQAPPTSPGGNGVVTEPVATPDIVPWWKEIATALVPGTERNGAFGTGTAFGPSVEPKVSAAGPGTVQAGMGFDQIPPALRNVMLAGAGLFLLSLFVKK
ncbi:MAG: hypothetical protein GY906_22885 [bacterium]|nr:hypothetical protein [bacterium]